MKIDKKTGETKKYKEEEWYTSEAHPLYNVMNEYLIDHKMDPLDPASEIEGLGIPLGNAEIAEKLLLGIENVLGDEVSAKTNNLYNLGFDLFPAEPYDPESETKSTSTLKTNDKLSPANFRVRSKASGAEKKEEKKISSMWSKISTLFVGSNSFLLTQGKEAAENAKEMKHHLWFFAEIRYK